MPIRIAPTPLWNAASDLANTLAGNHYRPIPSVRHSFVANRPALSYQPLNRNNSLRQRDE